jgi:transcriptional regulator with XRE-family HTH domain
MTKEQLKAARLSAGLSQSQAAAKTGVKIRSIQDWEQGRSKPMTEFLAQSYLDALKK